MTGVPPIWLECHRPDPRPRPRLFCLACAGGSAALFRGWQQTLDAVEVCPIQLPGRGRRISEPLMTDLSTMARTVAAAIRPACDGRFAIFGHSMGGLIGFEVARILQEEHRRVAACLIVASVSAPHLAIREAATHDLPGEAFVAYLRTLGATPPEILDDADARALFLPIIRADFQAVQTYQLVEGRPLECPIVALVGDHDPLVAVEHACAWARHTTRTCPTHVVPGDHFLVQRNAADCMRVVRDAMRTVCAPS